MPLAHRQHILFSDIFEIDESVIEGYGAFNISLLGDLPLFIDPFLIFNSEKPEYQKLHNDIITYLVFLRDKSVMGIADPGLLSAWYKFSEVKQTWLGFSESGNSGSGLGNKFAQELNSNLYRIFSPNAEQITVSKHIEKVCLIRGGVGKDNISDFTTHLIKEFLLSYTEKFAKSYVKTDKHKCFNVPKVCFNYETEVWEPKKFDLPFWGQGKDEDYIILVPQDLLTRDDTWINRADLISSYDKIVPSVNDEQMRAQINNYFFKKLPSDPKISAKESAKKKREAISDTVDMFPDIIDYYIKFKEETGDEAVLLSEKKVQYAQSLFLDKFTQLVALVADSTPFYTYDLTTIEDALNRVECLKDAIENKDGHQFLYSDKDTPVSAENELKVAYRFLWFNSINNPQGLAVDKSDMIAVNFKLATNKKIRSYLTKKDDEAIKDEAGNADRKHEVTVVFAFDAATKELIYECVRGLKSKTRHVTIINAAETLKTDEIAEAEEDEVASQKNPTIFISYSHDNKEWALKNGDPDTHRNRVFTLVEKLESEGIQCVIDRRFVNPVEGWARWMMNGIEDADFVLVIASETYNRRFRGKEEPDKGHGAQWEGAIITQEIYEANGKNQKFVPVIFEHADAAHIPLPIRSATRYNVSNDIEYDELYYYITNQPPYETPKLGPIRQRPKK